MGFGSYGEYPTLKRLFPDRSTAPSGSGKTFSHRAGGVAFDVDVQVKQEDVEAFFSALRDLTAFANLTRSEAIRRGALTIANSLRSSTKQARRFRQSYPGFETHTMNGHSWTNPIWNVEVFRQGFPEDKMVGYRAGTKRDKASKWVLDRAIAKREANRRSPIQNRGLAKQSWFWAASRLDQRGAGAGKFSNLDPSAYVDVSEHHDAQMSQITITNRLGYIRSAFLTGPNAPETAMARGARYILHYIDRQVAKQTRRFA